MVSLLLRRLGKACLTLAALTGLGALAEGASAQPVAINRIAIFEQAMRDGQAGNLDAARQAFRFLLRSSPDAEDEAILLGLLADLRRANPWLLRGGLSANPSTNVTGVSARSSFTTDMGEFTIADGGRPVAGMTLAGQVEFGRGFVLGPGREVLALMRLQRQSNPAAHLNRNEAYLEASYQAFTRKGSLTITPSVGFVAFDQAREGDTKPDRRILSLTVAGEWFRSPVSTTYASVKLARSEFLYQPHNSATSGEVSLGHSFFADARTSYNFGATLGRSGTNAAHSTGTSLTLQAGVNRAVLGSGNLGLNLALTGTSFDGPFPILGTRRQDGTLAVTVSYGDDRIKVFGQVPELSCTYRRTNSNVALYATQSSDCQIGLAMRF